jgi:HTH-type transcriptional regulator/antitoxin HipB
MSGAETVATSGGEGAAPDQGDDAQQEFSNLPTGSEVPGLIRRARRCADLSQRALAARLGVSQSKVARWETGRVCPSLVDLERVLSAAGFRLAILDAESSPVTPMSELVIRDRAGRRFPAHVDPRAQDWWVPDGLHLTAMYATAHRRSALLGIPQMRYHRRHWRALVRLAHGEPDDHPTRAEVLAELDGRWPGDPTRHGPRAAETR